MDDEVVERRSRILSQRRQNPRERFSRDPAREQLVEKWSANDEKGDAQRGEKKKDQRRPAATHTASSSEIVLIRCDDWIGFEM